MASRESTILDADEPLTAEVTNPTPTFGFSRPVEGTYWGDDWDYNFDILEHFLTVRDLQGNIGDYTPNSNRLFLATGTGRISVGNGTTWDAIPTTGENPQFNSASVSSAPSASTDVARQAELSDLADNPHGNAQHTETYVTSADIGDYTEADVAETITATWTFNGGIDASDVTMDTASVSTAPTASTDVLRQSELTTHTGVSDAHHSRYTDDEARAAVDTSGGSGGLESTTQTSNYTASAGDLVLADASGGGFTVTLPAPSTTLNVAVKKIDATTNAVTIATPGTETIDGASQLSITGENYSRSIASDGSNYFIV